jgi:ankyrin repeat protein
MALAAGAPLRIIDLLVQECPEVLELTNKFGATPLHVAMTHRSADEVVDGLLQHDPWHRTLQLLTQDGDLPIHMAARVGCTRHVAQQLLDPCPEHVRARNGAGWTPTELAVQNGNCPEEVRLYFQEMEDSII